MTKRRDSREGEVDSSGENWKQNRSDKLTELNEKQNHGEAGPAVRNQF